MAEEADTAARNVCAYGARPGTHSAPHPDGTAEKNGYSQHGQCVLLRTWAAQGPMTVTSNKNPETGSKSEGYFILCSSHLCVFPLFSCTYQSQRTKCQPQLLTTIWKLKIRRNVTF